MYVCGLDTLLLCYCVLSLTRTWTDFTNSASSERMQEKNTLTCLSFFYCFSVSHIVEVYLTVSPSPSLFFSLLSLHLSPSSGVCGCCGALRPRYKRLVDNIFPEDPEVRSDSDTFCFFGNLFFSLSLNICVSFVIFIIIWMSCTFWIVCKSWCRLVHFTLLSYFKLRQDEAWENTRRTEMKATI